jgi:hypothetical protein
VEANYQFVSACVTFGICACLLLFKVAGLPFTDQQSSYPEV